VRATDGEEGVREGYHSPWKLGDAVQVTPRNDDPACGNVVYCQTLEDGRFVIGVKGKRSREKRGREEK